MVDGKRTEEDKVLQAPIKVTFGKTEYNIEILPVKKSRAWRASFDKTVSEIPDFNEVTGIKEYKDIANAVFVALPDKVIDLVFLYAEKLKREEIEEIATDAQIVEAFNKITDIAFPLVTSLVGAMGRLSR